MNIFNVPVQNIIAQLDCRPVRLYCGGVHLRHETPIIFSQEGTFQKYVHQVLLFFAQRLPATAKEGFFDQTIYFSIQEVVSGLIEVFTDPEEERFPNLVRTADCNAGEYHVGQLGVAFLQLHLGALRGEVLTGEKKKNLKIIN